MKDHPVNEIIRNRRAIYTPMFSGDLVPDEIIENMLENARWAPTHKLTEPWSFRVFKDKGIQQLAKFQAELYQQKFQGQDSYKEEIYQKLLSKPLACSHVVSIGMVRDPKKQVPEIEEIAAVACAVQNMWLTASAYRVGCYWSTGGITYYEEAKPYFGLEEKDRLMGFLYLGMRDGKWPDGRRQPLDNKVTWIT